LLVGVDVSQAKHRAGIGTQTNVTCRKRDFTHTREGFTLFEQTRRDHLVKRDGRRLLIALEPAGISWQGLYARLRSGGDDVCLVRCQAVRHNRQTMHDGARKTDEKDASRVLD
jgi:transposase